MICCPVRCPSQQPFNIWPLLQQTSLNPLKMKKTMSHPRRKTKCPTKCQQATKSSNVSQLLFLFPLLRLCSLHVGVGKSQRKHTMIVITLFTSLLSVGASVGDARENGEAAPCCSREQDCKVSLPSDRPPCSLTALVQEWKRVQKGSKNRGFQGVFLSTSP